MRKAMTYKEGIEKISKQFHQEHQYLLDIFKDEPYNVYTILRWGNDYTSFVSLYGCLDEYGYWWWQVQSGVPSQDFTEENYKFGCLTTRLRFCPPDKFGEILDKFYDDKISLVEFIKSRTE